MYINTYLAARFRGRPLIVDLELCDAGALNWGRGDGIDPLSIDQVLLAQRTAPAPRRARGRLFEDTLLAQRVGGRAERGAGLGLAPRCDGGADLGLGDLLRPPPADPVRVAVLRLHGRVEHPNGEEHASLGWDGEALGGGGVGLAAAAGGLLLVGRHVIRRHHRKSAAGEKQRAVWRWPATTAEKKRTADFSDCDDALNLGEIFLEKNM